MSGIAVAALAAGVLIVAAAIAFLLLRRRDAPIETPRQAADAAEQALAGFVAADAVVGSDGHGALAIATDGRVAAIRRRGRRVSVREVSWAAMRATAAGIVVEFDVRGADAVTLAGIDALDVRRLAAAGDRAALA